MFWNHDVEKCYASHMGWIYPCVWFPVNPNLALLPGQGWGSWSPGGSSHLTSTVPKFLPALAMWHCCRAGRFHSFTSGSQGPARGAQRTQSQESSSSALLGTSELSASIPLLPLPRKESSPCSWDCSPHLAATKVLKASRETDTFFVVVLVVFFMF